MLTTPSDPKETPQRPRRRVVFNVVYSILLKVQSGAFSYVTTLLLLHALKVEEYGLYSVLFLGSIMNLSLLARLGLASVLQRFIPEYFGQSKFRMISRLFRSTNIVQLAAAVLLLAAACIFAPQLAVFLKDEGSATAIRIFAVGALGYLLSENFRSVLGGMFMQNTVFWVNMVYSTLRLAAIFVVCQMPEPFLAVVAVESGLYVLTVVFYEIAYRRAVAPHLAADTHADEPMPWKRLGRYTALSYANEVGVMLLNQATGLFIVTSLLGGAVVGLYGLASRIVSLIQNMLPSNILHTVIMPLFFSEYGASREKARFGFTLLCKLSLLPTIPMAVWTCIMARPLIVELFDARYGDAAPILAVIAAFLPMETLRTPVGIMLQNAERIDLLIYSKVFGVANILLSLWLVPIYGVMALVWVSVLAVAGQNIISYVWIVRILHSGTDLVGMLKLVINGAISALILFLMAPYFHGVVGIVVSAVIYGVIYLGINVLHKTFTREERDFMNANLPRPIWLF